MTIQPSDNSGGPVTAVPVPPLTDAELAEIEARATRAPWLRHGEVTDALTYVAFSDVPRLAASLRAARAELAEERRLADIRLKRIDQLESDQLEAGDELRSAWAERDQALAEVKRLREGIGEAEDAMSAALGDQYDPDAPPVFGVRQLVDLLGEAQAGWNRAEVQRSGALEVLDEIRQGVWALDHVRHAQGAVRRASRILRGQTEEGADRG